MGRVRKFGASAAVVVAITAATTLMSPIASAQAPVCSTGAQYGTYGGSGWARCSGTGVTQTRVVLFCQQSNGSYTTHYGPWVENSVRSFAWCSSSAFPISVGYQTQ
ncbi:hypothetical protein [Sinosporangium siamense]|uniref:Uncharacterized protein n=1 Tax=Sinosporangium siamense TaxID=1367973 RepID=A0A919RG85_9ACTN|nr:hypothetical protein [Sinosporangium siamense]GII92195.1 hypothetical protein Ssi02_24260 [Sinosporangium siamense]